MAALRHRGPDGQGSFIDRELSVGLAHVRLAIIDLLSGDQPLSSADGQVVLVYNGEIYDFERLREELAREGHAFRTKSDAEVILHLYLRHGLRFFEHLRGEFAFLLLDRAKGRLLAVRDRFGIKPLYVARTARGGWVFSSEVKGLHATELIPRAIELGPHVFSDGAATIFRGVRHVAPGTALDIDVRTGACQVLRYWSPNFPRQDEAEADRGLAPYAARVDQLLTEAIRLRLRADVPVGLYLSGGIDSALVAAKVGALAGRAPQAFTVAFTEEGERYNEAPHARRVAEHLGLEHHVLGLGREQLWSHLEACLWHVEAPLGSLAPVGKYLLSELARRHVKVVLTGEGADEVFLGYLSFRRALTASGRAALWLEEKTRSVLGQALLGVFAGSAAEAPRRAWADEDASSWEAAQLEGRHPVIRRQYRGLKDYLMPVVLAAYGDRTEMAHSIEGRPPFLDHLLFEFARTIPLTHKLRDGVEKYILRELARGVLPPEIAQRGKWHFSTRVPALVEGQSATVDRLIRTYLSREAVERAGLFDWTGLQLLRSLRGIPAARDAVDRFVFSVCCMQILHRAFIEGERFTAPASPPSP